MLRLRSFEQAVTVDKDISSNGCRGGGIDSLVTPCIVTTSISTSDQGTSYVN